ncbi:GemA protein [Maritimibacter sp. 55A14]|uniref:regulatory protein GemA n=1 Tax=Maritimibacter sp. 55A14 TaxID=2174844 RepID=UPI000D61A49E|nr:regulatory protein GemA [Maritimibacter sp. 55A14]PWE29983.1 GemA protein [Maritimibacter sp. 55A14]
MSAVKTIYAGVRQLGLDAEEDRRDLYERVTGKRRLRDMRPREKDAVVEELRRLGFRRVSRRRKLDGPYAPKLQALWIAAWNLGLTKSRDDGALLAFVRRQTGIDHTRFLRDPKDAARAIEGLKAWLARDGGVDWSEAKDIPAWARPPGAKVALAQFARLNGGNREQFPAFWRAVQDVLGPRSNPGHLGRTDWQKVMNALGERVRAESDPA